MNTEDIRDECVKMATDWYTNPRTGYLIRQRSDKYVALLHKFGADFTIDQIPNDDIKKFYEELHTLINGA